MPSNSIFKRKQGLIQRKRSTFCFLLHFIPVCANISFKLKPTRVPFLIYSFADFRTADELVQMIAFFYYKAKKPSWINDKALARPF